MYNTYQGSWYKKDSINPMSASAKSPDSTRMLESQPKTPEAAMTSPVVQADQIPIAKVSAATTQTGQQTVTSPPPLKDTGRNLRLSSRAGDSAISTVTPRSVKPSLVAKTAPGVRKLREVNLKISRKMVFVDMSKDGVGDTITLFVYFEKSDTGMKNQAILVPPSNKKMTGTDTVAESRIQGKNEGVKTTIPGCGELASQADLDGLRLEILKANSEEDKIAAATNAFSLKCFSVSQVRLLASLLVSDKARYRLMDAAQKHIADRNHFRELADMYTDKNFQKKFLAMADKRT